MKGNVDRRTEYEKFEQESDAQRRLLVEERLILEATEVLSERLEELGMSKTVLAKRLGCTKGNVTQALSGRNLTLRTLAGIADVLGADIRVEVVPRRERRTFVSPWKRPQSGFAPSTSIGERRSVVVQEDLAA